MSDLIERLAGLLDAIMAGASDRVTCERVADAKKVLEEIGAISNDPDPFMRNHWSGRLQDLR